MSSDLINDFVAATAVAPVRQRPMTYNGCVGKKHYGLSETTNWYGFSAKPISQDTRCEFCYQHMKRMGIANREGMYKIIGHSPQIDCDSLGDHRLTTLNFNNFRIRVESADGQTPFLVNTEHETKRRNGVLIVDMPETADYSVVLENMRPSYDDSYYTYTMRVGDRDVVVNDGRKIYYQHKTRVSGFRTGTNESFRFVANTPGNGDAPAGSAGSNVITIVVDLYRRQRNPQYVSVSYNSRGFDFFGSGRESQTRGFDSYNAGFSAAAAAAPSVVGGRTETGQRYVGDVITTSTDDVFVKTGTFTATIQLIHLADSSNVSVLDTAEQFELRREQERRAEEERRRAEERRRQEMLAEQARLLVPVPPTPVAPTVQTVQTVLP